MALAFSLWLAGRLLTFGVVEDAPLPAGRRHHSPAFDMTANGIAGCPA
jgi:hypothetical protein